MLLISNRLLAWVSLFSVLAVWSHWNIFSISVFALGFNATLFGVGVAIVLYCVDSSYSSKRDWAWLIPMFLISVSYSLYENPWLKLISLFLLPIIVGVFCAYSHFSEHKTLVWNGKLLGAISMRLFKPLGEISNVVMAIFNRSVLPTSEVHKSTLSRVLRGLVLLIPLSFVVLLLLSSADALFAALVRQSFLSVLNAMNFVTIFKLVLSAVLTVALLAMALGWSGVIDYEDATETKEIDGLVAGIVLGGLLLIYTAFLILQLDNLVIAELPDNYHEAERMVKSGFWQLFLLAVLNTGLFFVVYRKTGMIAQWVLRVFIIASSLLMVSAAWKLGLYNYTFGLSYEKFFAAYTTLFALGVLLYLVAASFSPKRCNAVKSIAFAALWGYAIASISPIERIIFHTNLYLAEQSSTRITLTQLTQLSLDVWDDVDEVYSAKLAVSANDQRLWRTWRRRQHHEMCKRAWYETNLSVIAACR